MSSVKQDESLVYVFMITYNHEAFISEAIEGVLNQVTNFEYKLVIGEDCSTDNTRRICKQYYEKFPTRIQLLLHENNVGVYENVIQTLRACRGKYTAICEGDDYWTDPLKLQKQVDFLEANPDFSICFHRSMIKSSDSTTNGKINNPVALSQEYNGLDAYKMTRFQSASMVFRNSCLQLPDHFSEYIFPDNGIILSLIFNGKIYGFSDVMSVYRKHDGGLSLPTWDKAIAFIHMMDLIDIDFGERVFEATKYRRFNRFYYMALQYIKQQNFKYFVKSVLKCINYDPKFIFSPKFYGLVRSYIYSMCNDRISNEKTRVLSHISPE